MLWHRSNLLPGVELSLHGVDVLLQEVHQFPERVRRPGQRLDRLAQLVHLPLGRLAVPAPARVRDAGIALLEGGILWTAFINQAQIFFWVTYYFDSLLLLRLFRQLLLR